MSEANNQPPSIPSDGLGVDTIATPQLLRSRSKAPGYNPDKFCLQCLAYRSKFGWNQMTALSKASPSLRIAQLIEAEPQLNIVYDLRLQRSEEFSYKE
jgi:hypothetical protein